MIHLCHSWVYLEGNEIIIQRTYLCTHVIVTINNSHVMESALVPINNE
jgi:hypothetical protein